MRKVIRVLVFTTLFACGGSHSTQPDGSPDAISATSATIEIDIDQAPLMVAFRDGLEHPWQIATMLSPTQFTAEVHGPYVTAVVVDAGLDARHIYATLENAQTPDDDHTITITSQSIQLTGSNVTAHVVEPGRLFMGNDIGISHTADWDAGLVVSPGPHDLFLFSVDHALIRAGVDATHDVALGTLDADASGVAMDHVAFTATNANAGDTVTSHAVIASPTTPYAIPSTSGPGAAVAIIPDSALGANMHQMVSVIATSASGDHSRLLRKTYHAGDNTAYTLPNLIGGATWSLAPNATASWSTLASSYTYYDLSLFASNDSSYYELAATSGFISATGVHQLTLDTDLPGYQSAWLGDLSQGYDLEIAVQNTQPDRIESEQLDQQVMVSTRTVDAHNQSKAACNAAVPPESIMRPCARITRSKSQVRM